jgi:hypothetical protein
MVQSAVLDRWPDGSARWALLDLQPPVTEGASVSIQCLDALPASRPLARQANRGIEIDTGAATFSVGHTRFPFEAASIDSAAALDAAATRLDVTGRSGVTFQPEIERVAIELNGPLRAVALVEGTIRVDLRSRLALTARLHFFAGKASVRCDLTIRNPQRARHQGGFWELGDAGAILLRDVSLHIALPQGGERSTLHCSEFPGAPMRRLDLPFELHQESSGGEQWRSPVHRNRGGQVPLGFRGYRLTAGASCTEGLRATPIVQLSAGERRLAVTLERFWENFPKAISADEGLMTVHLFPAPHADLHELQGGEQKTHTIWMSFADDGTSEIPLDWCRSPSRAVPDPMSACAAGAIPWLTPKADDPHEEYLALVDAAIDGTDSFVAKRERVDEYGWRHFGDLWADHEAVFHTGPGLFVSHYNNQYDPIAGCAYQFLRSGDLRWWTLMDDMARHVVDIDIYHTDQDWAKYNHGLFWHTAHHHDAGLSTHRSYPHAEGIPGGGPSASHLYTTGLMLHHFLTGDRRSRDAVLELAHFAIDADDGEKSVFGCLDRGRTGLVSASAEPGYHGPGRAPGNAINALVDAHRLTGDARFLDKAEELVRRCIHPHDDIDARGLLDVERRWFYTIFLQALGKLLHHLHETGGRRSLVAYARESLLAYARWMALHEAPYLDRPEILEFPTETWAAQDLRKSEVFTWAASHADAADRERFLERSRFFFGSAVATLSSMPTRTLTRPVALLLSYGWSQAAEPAPVRWPGLEAPEDVGAPTVFEPQKTRAIRRARTFAAVGALTLLAGAAIVGLRLTGFI